MSSRLQVVVGGIDRRRGLAAIEELGLSLVPIPADNKCGHRTALTAISFLSARLNGAALASPLKIASNEDIVALKAKLASHVCSLPDTHDTVAILRSELVCEDGGGGRAENIDIGRALAPQVAALLKLPNAFLTSIELNLIRALYSKELHGSSDCIILSLDGSPFAPVPLGSVQLTVFSGLGPDSLRSSLSRGYHTFAAAREILNLFPFSMLLLYTYGSHSSCAPSPADKWVWAHYDLLLPKQISPPPAPYSAASLNVSLDRLLAESLLDIRAL